ncbi:hypothetical protein FF011L_06330 [Roseimaritima multifibrata]|uniref:Uncharacterized protein n=1 Tax=Roseimaritima multifibrata TaxID=1930274 RepID=A0A517MAT1_9BACT|nr:hypothetical protein [Roseimaritima multifibrata]QDS91897.1 hypothetical protein FF011L_06330 [Roseimaritima multifibrata]
MDDRTQAGKPKNWLAPKRQQRQKVLIVTHADRYIEVFGENIDVHIANMTATSNVAGEITAEDFLELSLPMPYRDIYFPGMLRKTGTVEEIRPADLAVRQINLSMLRAANSMTQEAPTWTL